jgi:DedD protein
MEDKNELSDIVLEKGGDKKGNAKKIILLVAVLIVVFLVVLIAMKLINKPAEDTKEALTLPPAPITATTQEPKQEQLFEQVPIKKEEDSFEKVVQKLKEQEQSDEIAKPTPPKPPVEEIKKEQSPKLEEIVKEINEPAPTPKIAPEETKPTQQAVSNNLYIQVGATLKNQPSKKFLEQIKEAGYTHTLYRVQVGDKTATKILVGPFKDRSEANEHMPKIKQSINKEAFLYRVKN